MNKIDQITSRFKELQDRICKGLEALDTKSKFVEDLWDRKAGGGGRTRTISAGGVIEKGGVNFSHVHGPMPEKISSKLGLKEGQGFHATGVSIVLHSQNPFVPTIHMNVRYFQMEDGKYWFGGGMDITPSYFDREDTIGFHSGLKDICDKYDSSFYGKFKPWCDTYFFLKHREESRGIGGLFFDHLMESDTLDFDQLWDFVIEIGDYFVPAYNAYVSKYRDASFGESEKEWQRFRQSRYVEFNLLWDKGTRFGLDTGGRAESILVSMPPEARWSYCHEPDAGSPEAEMQANLKAQDWLEPISS